VGSGCHRPVIALAGLAAENKLIGGFNSKPSEDDLMNALRAVREALGTFPWTRHPGKSPPFRDIYKHKLAPREVEALEWSYRAAAALLDAHEPLLYLVSSRLYLSRTLHETDLTPILGHRAHITILGTSSYKAFFVVGGYQRPAPESPPEPSLLAKVAGFLRDLFN